MKCNDLITKSSMFLHIIALIIAIGATFIKIKQVKQDKYNSPILPIAFTIMILLRLPNQICVAMNEDNGWFSVIGSIIGALSLSYLTYVIKSP